MLRLIYQQNTSASPPRLITQHKRWLYWIPLQRWYYFNAQHLLPVKALSSKFPLKIKKRNKCFKLFSLDKNITLPLTSWNSWPMTKQMKQDPRQQWNPGVSFGRALNRILLNRRKEPASFLDAASFWLVIGQGFQLVSGNVTFSSKEAWNISFHQRFM